VVTEGTEIEEAEFEETEFEEAEEGTESMEVTTE
jgi:hypothetical protein